MKPNPKKKVKFEFPTDPDPDRPIRVSDFGLVGRVGKRGGRGYDGPEWVSRDHALIIPCLRTVCPVNRDHHCSMPSKIAINSAGECMTGMEFRDKPAVQPTKMVCRICGGKIEPNPRGPSYYPPFIHVGEKMSHQAEPR